MKDSILTAKTGLLSLPAKMSFHSNGKRASGEGKSSVRVVVRIRPEVGKEKVVNRCVFPSTKNSKVVELRNPALKSLPTEDVVCHR